MLKNKVLEENIQLNRCKGARVQCLTCTNDVEITNSRYHYLQKREGDSAVYCLACKHTDARKRAKIENQEHNMLLKYGVPNFFKVKKGQELCRQRMKEKYGEPNPSLVPELKKRQLEGRMKLVEGTGKTIAEIGARKAYEVRKIKYGDLSGAVPRATSIATCLDKYGAETFFGSLEGRMSLENFIKRHGKIKGAIEYKRYKKAHAVTKEKMIKKYGEEVGSQKYENWKKNTKQNYDNFIKRWGIEEGSIRFEKFVTDFLQRTRKGRSSKVSTDFFNTLKDNLPLNGKIAFEIIEHPYSLDCVVTLDDKKYVIEYNGTFWHADPRFYVETDLIRFRSRHGTTVESIWKKDKNKLEFLKTLGYAVIIVWEYDDRKNREIEIEKVIRRFE